MNIHIEDDALTEILEYGRTNDKKYRKLPKEDSIVITEISLIEISHHYD